MYGFILFKLLIFRIFGTLRMAAEVASTQPCVVKVFKLQEEKDYKKEDICPTVKYTTEEKALLLDKKKSKKTKEPNAPKTLKKDKNGKSQMKISTFFSLPSKSAPLKRCESGDSKDSGISSRADTPEEEASDEEEEEEDQDQEEGEEEELEAEKKKFLDDLSESEKEESSSEEESEDDFDPNDSDDGTKKTGFMAKKKAAPKKAASGTFHLDLQVFLLLLFY